MIRAALNWLRLCWIDHEIERIEARIDDDQKAVDDWPKHRGAWLAEVSRLRDARDQVTGRGDRVNYSFGRRARQ